MSTPPASPQDLPRTKWIFSLRMECGARMRVSLPFKGHGPKRPWRFISAHGSCALDRIRHSDRHAPGRTQERHLPSKIRWFTEFCNSHYLSQLAAFFIDAWAKRSTVKSCLSFAFLAALLGATLFFRQSVIKNSKGGADRTPSARRTTI